MSTTEPVLLIAFNRPELFEQLITRLRDVRPQRVYVAIDGPRTNHAADRDLVRRTQLLAESIDWTTDVKTLFQESNLGCGLGVSTALSWFFAHESRGIVLEDDVLPQPSFFDFCSELLDRYTDDERVLAISGCNFVPPEFQEDPTAAYRFSRVPHIWGWATWRRSWDLHELDMSNWRDRMTLKQLWQVSGRSLSGTLFWKSIFDLMARKQVDTWDMQFVFEGMVRNMLTATSNVNLVDNIGFGASATHTERRPEYLHESENIALPTAPVAVVVDERADDWSREVVFEATAQGILAQSLRYLKRKFVPHSF